MKRQQYEITLKLPVRGIISDGEADQLAESLLIHLHQTYEITLAPSIYIKHREATFKTRVL